MKSQNVLPRDPEEPMTVGGQPVAPGSSSELALHVSELYNGDPLVLRVVAVRGRRPGPSMFLMGALHGDELVGTEIVRRLINVVHPDGLSGTLLLVPVGNPYGFISNVRYMSDQRDINRCFPGRRKGSPSSRMAHFLMTEIVSRCEYGVELHSAAQMRRNSPQIRYDAGRADTRRLAEAFGSPFLIDSPPPPNSLRGTADPERTAVILYEAGQILEIDEGEVDTGVEGCLRVMAAVGMVAPREGSAQPSVALKKTRWVRTQRGGVLTHRTRLGARLSKGEHIASVAYPHDGEIFKLAAPHDGVVIGLATLPLVNPGDAVCHLAW